MIQFISSRLATALIGAAICLAPVAAVQAQAGETLKVATDVGFAPFAMRKANGQLEGFSYDLIKAVASKAGYSGVEVTDTPFSGIFAGLFSKRFDLIFGPVNITKDRATQMLFTEPYLAGGVGFLTRKGAKVAGFEDLKGKIIAVNNGSFSDKWLQENQAKYGYEIQRFNKNADAVQAVLSGRAFANMAETAVLRYIASQTAQASVAYHFATGTSFGYPMRKEDVALRDRIEQAIECLKADGTLARIHTQWFGTKPDAGTAGVDIYPGFGAPGFEGHNATPHAARCS